jgi:SAM-dependent methyltransferase
MANEASQDYIWSYYQNEDPSIFDAAHVRLEFIVRLAARLTPGGRPELLNIGVGVGHLERTARARDWPVTSLDPSAESIANLEPLGVVGKVGRIEALPFADEQFDVVVVSEVLEHLTNEDRAAGLAEIRRVLKPNGHLLGTVPYRELLAENRAVCPQCHHHFHRWGHTTSFDLERVRHELSPHFIPVACRRTAFVQYRGRSLGGKLKSLLRLLMAKCGARVAVPNIYFAGRKS